MSTTTIRLPDELKARIARVAELAGTNTHSFILEAIAEKTERQELRNDFHSVADRRYADIVASGETIPWASMRRHLEKRIAGKPGRRPSKKKIAR